MRLAALALPLLVLGLVAPAEAGPPCICWQLEIGAHKSLPWGEGEFERSKDYAVARVQRDTLALLDTRTPVLVRMETLRRAAIYIDRDVGRTNALLQALQARALDAEALDRPSARAWFDAGYATACFHQMGGAGVDRDGYAWVAKAARLAKNDPSMELAAAMLCLMDHRDSFLAHAKHARAGAGGNKLLDENLALLAKRGPQILEYFERKDRAATKKSAEEKGKGGDRR